MKRHEFAAYVAPSVIIMLLLMVLPLLMTIWLSFSRFSFGQTPSWYGFTNYVNVLSDDRFWDSVVWTLTYIVFTLPLQLVLGYVIATFLTQAQVLRGVFVSGYLLPFIVTPVVGTLVFSWLFKDKWGFYSYLFSQIGLDIKWYASAIPMKALLIMHGVWSVTPFVILVMYAGLQAMPYEPIEAAIMDGATTWQRIRYVVIPHLMPLISFVTMINIMDAYRVFDSVYVMTRGLFKTESIMYYNYQVAFGSQNLGRASAVSVLMVLGIFVVLIPLLRRTYKEQREAR
ncbi:MAG: sugar ABC transporter permease [Anaerolineae bacterium]|nr:sugar ABC transporter permease [Anaerolineae bacterium]